jgi:hypothetical protein
MPFFGYPHSKCGFVLFSHKHNFYTALKIIIAKFTYYEFQGKYSNGKFHPAEMSIARAITSLAANAAPVLTNEAVALRSG